MNSFFLSRWPPPNAERNAEPYEAIGVRVRTQERIVLPFLLILAPSVSSADTLPDTRGRLAVSILIFIFNHTGRLFCVLADRNFYFTQQKRPLTRSFCYL